jgi:hypothetical protein
MTNPTDTDDRDPFALARQPEDEEQRRAAVLAGFTEAERNLVLGLARLMPGYRYELSYFAQGKPPDRGGEVMSAPDPFALDALRRDGAELRRRAEAMAAKMREPLLAGDAGLIEAAQRLRDWRAQEPALYRDFKIDVALEAEIINGVLDPAANELKDFIDGAAQPAGAAGVAAKLRALLDDDPAIEETHYDGLRIIREALDFIEREAEAPR